MQYLILSVLSSSILLIFFKLFDKYKVNIMQAIAVNYIMATVFSFFSIQYTQKIVIGESTWLIFATMLGGFFFLVFNLCSKSTVSSGIGITSIAMKLAVLFPITIGILFYKEPVSFQIVLGILLGIFSLFLLTYSPANSYQSSGKLNLLFPILVWIGSGFCDSTVQLANKLFSTFSQNGYFTFITFMSASIVGMSYTFVYKKQRIDFKSLIGGLALGIPNYFSIYFLFKCLEHLKLDYQIESGRILTINNILIVITSLVIGLLAFREKLNKINVLGIIIALMAIYLISF
jgi:drug/metabolite transporter (DMT)-like permease